VDVAKLSSALGALSTSLQGRGDKLGAVLVRFNDYLRGFNPSLPALSADLASGADVLDNYTAVAPDLVRTLDNAAVTSTTVTDRRKEIPALLGSLIALSDDGRALFRESGGPLLDALHTLRPTSELLGEYSPMFPCLFASFDQIRIQLEHAIGYHYPGIHLYTQVLPGAEGYRFPRDLPRLPTTPTAPSCYGGPLPPDRSPSPHVAFDDGWKGLQRTDRMTVDPTALGPVNPLPRVGAGR